MIVVQLILLPFHFLFRIVARTVLLISTLGAALVLPLLVLYAPFALEDEDIWKDLIPTLPEGMGLVALLGTLGILAAVISKTWQAILNSLATIGTEVGGLFATGWLPDPVLDFRASLSTTWSDNLAQVYPKAKKVLLSSGGLIASLLLLFLLVWPAYLSLEDEKQWREEIHSFLQVPPPHVVVARPDDRIASYLFQKGTVFSLAFVEDAVPKTGAGICLTKHHKTWLRKFKKAILKCPQESKIELEVMGFASASPVQAVGVEGGGNSPSSDALNCEIANRRAEEVIDFLISDAGDSFECGTGEDRRRNDDHRYDRKGICKRSPEELEFPIGPNGSVKISYKPWPSHDQLASNKPVDDDDRERGLRLRDVEFLNRSVHLRLSEGACKVEDAGR